MRQPAQGKHGSGTLRHAIFCIAAALMMVAGANPVAAQNASTAVLDVEFRIEQPDAALTIDEVCCGRLAFSGPPVRSAGAGIGGEPVWVALPALRPGAVLSLTKMVDEAELYERRPGTDDWIISRGGDSIASSGQALPVPRIAFLLSEEAPPETERFLRVVQPTTIRFGLKAWDPQAFRADFERRRLVRTLSLGFIAAIVIYNLVVSLVARDGVFALNAVTIVSLLVIDLYLTGVGALYLWPRSVSNLMLNLGLAGTTIFGALFIRQFLKVSAGGSVPARPLLVLAALAGVAAAMLVTGIITPYWLPQTALLLCVILMPVTAVVITLVELVRGNHSARILIVPLLGVMLPGGVLVLISSITAIPFGVIQPHLLEITLAFEALVFSLALASRIRMHQRDAEIARAELAQTELDSARRYARLQERERARVASELHDSIGHNLVMITGLLERGSASDLTHRDMEAAAKLSRRTVQRVRTISHDLHPATLSHLGWSEAIQSLFVELENAQGIEVRLTQSGGEPDLAPDAKLHVYRMLQELASNIAKHASATRCEAEIRNDGNALHIRIADNGVGLDDTSGLPQGLGLASIDERAKTLGGTWTLRSGDCGGAVAELTIPIAPGDAKAH